MKEQILQNIKNMDSHYNDDASYRQCLRNIFDMKEKTPNILNGVNLIYISSIDEVIKNGLIIDGL